MLLNVNAKYIAINRQKQNVNNKACWLMQDQIRSYCSVQLLRF